MLKPQYVIPAKAGFHPIDITMLGVIPAKAGIHLQKGYRGLGLGYEEIES